MNAPDQNLSQAAIKANREYLAALINNSHKQTTKLLEQHNALWYKLNQENQK